MLVTDIITLQNQLKRLIEKKKELYKAISDEKKERFFELTTETVFRHAFCLFHGKYYGKYDLIYGHKEYSIDRAKEWKTNEYRNFYYIRHKVDYGFSSYETKNIGFICLKKDLKHAIDLKSLWKHRVSEHNSTSSLQEFIDSVDTLDLFGMFNETLKEKQTLELIHEPKLGVENTVIFIEHERYNSIY